MPFNAWLFDNDFYNDPENLKGVQGRYHGKIAKALIFMSLKPSNMISMQFLTMTVDLIIKFRVDPSSRN